MKDVIVVAGDSCKNVWILVFFELKIFDLPVKKNISRPKCGCPNIFLELICLDAMLMDRFHLICVTVFISGLSFTVLKGNEVKSETKTAIFLQ